MSNVALRAVADADLPVFFGHIQDPVANHMAAFTHKDPSDRAAFDAHWTRIRGDDNITIRTILRDGEVAGHVASFVMAGDLEVTYWIGQEHWGKGVATRALTAFLEEVTTRPIYARVVKDNAGSIRVLEKCGFRVCGEDKGFAHGRGREVEELVMQRPT